LNSKIRSIKGLATGIGSLPHTDAEAALDLIFKYTPHIPFWPQLPKRDIRERMVAQFSEVLPFIKVTEKDIYFNPEVKQKELEKFYERIIAEDEDYFKVSEDFALGLHKFYQRLEKSDLSHIEYIKCQITGPFTFAASINDENGRALLHNPEFMEAITKSIYLKAAWQAKHFSKFGKKIILFYDEPYLGCFGSAYTPIDRKEVVNSLTESAEGFKQVVERYFTTLTRDPASTKVEVLFGVHCCGNTDWSIFTEIPKIDIISFDAYGFLDRVLLYAKELLDFFERGGVLAWGIVPTQAFTPEVKSSLLLQKLEQGLKLLLDKGIEQHLIRNNLIITPSCGLGTLSCETADSIFRCLQDLSYNFKNKSI